MTVLGECSGAFRLYYSRETRHAAASVLFFDPVDIVDQKKGNTGVVPSACAARVDGTAALAPAARIDARI